ncbi:KTSC domain-containing protein [Macrococcus equi]|uniref:KTSC domain-containing protein n=1 Tax=Macrococcus equi TaxID=3395462 RepID=UPI0039BE4EA2
MIQMIPVASSKISAVGYDYARSELFVRFQNGCTYKYSDVPSEKYSNLLVSDSKGTYLENHIIGAHYYRPA